MVLAVGDSPVTCYRQSLYNANPTCPPTRHDDCTQAAWVCHWQSTGQAKSYSVDVGVQQGILCKSTELSTLFSGKTAILRQSPPRHPAIGCQPDFRPRCADFAPSCRSQPLAKPWAYSRAACR